MSRGRIAVMLVAVVCIVVVTIIATSYEHHVAMSAELQTWGTDGLINRCGWQPEEGMAGTDALHFLRRPLYKSWFKSSNCP